MDEMVDVDGSDMHYAGSIYLKAYWANVIVIGACIKALLWALYQVYWISGVDMTKDVIKVQKLSDEEKQALDQDGK